MKKEVTVKLTDKEVVVRKMHLGKFAEVLKAMHELPKQISGLDQLDTDTFVSQLPTMLGTAMPEIVKILSIATDIAEDEINELGLDEVTELIVAVFEVNDISKVANNIKKMLARKLEPAAEPTNTGSTGQ